MFFGFRALVFIFFSFFHCFLLSCFFYFFFSIFSPLLFLSRGFSSRFFWTRTGHAETELHFNGHWPRSARFPTPFARQPTSTLFYSHPFTHAVDKNNLPINARPPAFLLELSFIRENSKREIRVIILRQYCVNIFLTYSIFSFLILTRPFSLHYFTPFFDDIITWLLFFSLSLN